MSLANRISKYPRISTTERNRRAKHDLPEIEAIREEAGSDSFEIDLISLFDSWNRADNIPWHTKAISLRTFQKKYFDAFKVSSGLLKDEQAEARKKLFKNDNFFRNAWKRIRGNSCPPLLFLARSKVGKEGQPVGSITTDPEEIDEIARDRWNPI